MISFPVGMLFHVLASLGFSFPVVCYSMYLLYYDQFSSGYAIPCTCFIRIQFSSGYAIPCICFVWIQFSSGYFPSFLVGMIFHVLALSVFSFRVCAIPCIRFSMYLLN